MSPPSLDVWDRAIRSLASSLGLDVKRLAGEWYARTIARWYDGQENAAALAYEDIRERLHAGEEAA